MGAQPGEMFAHRDIVDQAHPNDLSMLFAVAHAVKIPNVQSCSQVRTRRLRRCESRHDSADARRG